jgi:peptide deformylase
VTKIEWLSPLSIIQYPDPRLRAVNGRVGIFDEALAQLSKEMFEVMYDSEDGGVGLAAPQVGVNLRLMVFNPGKEREKEEEVVLVNPQVLSASGPIRPFEEGCLSFPGVYGEVLVSLPFDIFASSRFFCLRASAGKPRA